MKWFKRVAARLFFYAWLILMVTGCHGRDAAADETGRIQVVATTTLVGDVVRVIGGEHISLTVLLPVGGDPHGFNPTPQDVTKVASADVIFINGLGLEQFMTTILENAARELNIVDLSAHLEGIPSDHAHDGDEDDHEHEKIDPHVWWNPLNVAKWAEEIAEALAEIDPENGTAYAANAAAYKQQLTELDQWIQEQVAQIPAANRTLITDHDSLGYFVEQYGFELVGTVFPGLSSQSEPSAQELAELTAIIRSYGVPAIFVGTTVNQRLTTQVAHETGTKVVPIYTDSLSEAGGAAATYLDFMRHNVNEIAAALR